jgi:hypothetical protein
MLHEPRDNCPNRLRGPVTTPTVTWGSHIETDVSTLTKSTMI